MNEDEAPSSASIQAGESVLGLADLLRNVGAACTGYRQQLIDAGWPQPLADQIAGTALMTWQNRLLGECRG